MDMNGLLLLSHEPATATATGPWIKQVNPTHTFP
jgi:hypothetical protein